MQKVPVSFSESIVHSKETCFHASPIVSTTDIPGFYVSAGWWGGFKAIPAGGLTFAHTIANSEPHPLNACYSINRFKSLDYLLEAGTTVPTR